jgi:AraC-like DNA-binding protein
MTNDRIGTFVRECQVFAGQLLLVRAGVNQRTLVDEFVSRLPVPDHPLETLVMHGLLFNVAVRWSHGVHRELHVGEAIHCGFDSDKDLVRSWHSRHSSPIMAFADWATSFLDKVEQSHRPSPTVRVKEIIDRGSDKRLSVRSLAREAGHHPLRLRATFKRDFGMSMREYQTRRRIVKAAQLLAASDLKVDAVAREAGFPNRKNFYDAFKRMLRTTPSAVRSWSQADLKSCERRLFPYVES